MQRKQDTTQPAAMNAQDAGAHGADRRQFFRVGGLFAAGLAASSALTPVASWAGTPSTSTAQDIAILNTGERPIGLAENGRLLYINQWGGHARERRESIDGSIWNSGATSRMT